jgi:hypothetical protein
VRHGDDQQRSTAGNGFSASEWMGGALLFLVGWLLTTTYHPEDERHFLKCGFAILVCLILYQVARKFLSDAKLTGVLALSVVLAFLLLFVVPHHSLVEHAPKSPIGKALLIVVKGVAWFVLALAVVSVYVTLRGGGKRWRWFAERLPILSDFTLGLAEGIVPLVLMLTLAELVWRLTA